MPQIGGCNADDHEAGGDVNRVHDVSEPIRKGRAEDDLQPVLRDEPAVDDCVAGGRLHPTVGRQDPEGRKERAEGDHQRGDEMRPRRHELPAEQQHAEERRFQEERDQALVGQ